MRKILEKIVRYYFNKYHREKMSDIFIPNVSQGYFQPMDLVRDCNNRQFLYLGECSYFELYKSNPRKINK